MIISQVSYRTNGPLVLLLSLFGQFYTWFKLYLFELKQISNTYKYIQYKLGSERKPMAYEVNFLEVSKLQKR